MAKNKEIQTSLSFIDTIAKYSEDDLSNVEKVYSGDKPVFWGIRNTYSTLIQNCFMQSPTLRACCQSFTDYVGGNGVQINCPRLEGKLNRYGETVEDIISKMAQSYFLYGGYCLQIIYSKMMTVAEIYCVDFAKCRVNEDKTKVYYYPKGCSTYGKYETYDRFDPEHIRTDNLTQMYWYNGTSAPTLYPSAPWTSALCDVLTEIETSKFSLSTVSGGFLAKYVITIPDGGALTEEQKAAIEEAIKTKFTGTDATSNFMIYFNGGVGGDGQELKIDKIETDNSAESYLAIRDTAKANIYAACRTSPLIMGMGQANTLSTNEFSDAYNIYNRTVILPVQKKIERSFETILRYDDPLKIIKFSIDFE